jgi:hypothetical protein
MNEPIKKDDESSGQNPFWPGDKALGPEDSDKDTIIPIVPNAPLIEKGTEKP